jgi:hypothetical protein
MQKTIYLLNINDYEPEITAITYPRIEAYAERIGAQVYRITERKFHEWPVTYEKLQIHELARKHRDDWAIYIDSDALLHPELPDVTDLVPRDHVAHNANDFSPIRFADSDYMRRDGRHIGACNWLTIASSLCFDLWRPLEMTPAEAESQIHLTVPEAKIMKPEHLVDDYALTQNIARFGLKFTTLREIWAEMGNPHAEFFFHEYLIPAADKLTGMKATLERWGV